MEYGLAITNFTAKMSTQLQQVQQASLRKIFSGHPTSETAVVQHLAGLVSMPTRISILQAKYINRARSLPADALLTLLLPRLQVQRAPFAALKRHNHLWPKLRGNPTLDREAIAEFTYHARFADIKPGSYRSLLPKTVELDPLLTLPMSTTTRRQLICWRRGWLPGKPSPCLCLQAHLTRHHTLVCPILPPLPAPKNASAPPGRPLDLLLNTLPPANMPPPIRGIYADFWRTAWPQITLYIATLEALCAQGHPPSYAAEDHLFNQFFAATPTE